jgi:hypothetical protein
LKKQTKFLFRDHTGKIRSSTGETADQALGKFGTVVSWDDSTLQTVEIYIKGSVHRWTLTGSVP